MKSYHISTSFLLLVSIGIVGIVGYFISAVFGKQ